MNLPENLDLDNIPENKNNSEKSLFPGDMGELPLDTRRTLVRLLSGPYLDAQKHSKLWSVLLRDENVIRKYLNELFLVLVMNRDLQVAFIAQPDTEDTAGKSDEIPKLLRRVQLTFIDSALLLYLKQQLVQAETHSERAVVSKDDIYEQLRLYDKDENTDIAGFDKKIHASIEKMKKHNVLHKIKTTDDRFEVSPVLKLLFSTEEIQALTKIYKQIETGEVQIDGDEK